MKMCNEKYVDNWQNIEKQGGTLENCFSCKDK